MKKAKSTTAANEAFPNKYPTRPLRKSDVRKIKAETGVEQALANLKEATALYLEEVDLPERGGALLTTLEVDNA